MVVRSPLSAQELPHLELLGVMDRKVFVLSKWANMMVKGETSAAERLKTLEFRAVADLVNMEGFPEQTLCLLHSRT